MEIDINKMFSFLNENQLNAIREIVRDGYWGDCSEEFNGETHYAHGYYTNLNKGKKWSGTLSGISKAIKASGTNLISMCSDWWGDGSGDMMFFNMDLIEEKNLITWANQ